MFGEGGGEGHGVVKFEGFVDVDIAVGYFGKTPGFGGSDGVRGGRHRGGNCWERVSL